MEKLSIKIPVQCTSYLFFFVFFITPLVFVAVCLVISFLSKSFFFLCFVVPFLMIFVLVSLCLARRLKNQYFELDVATDAFHVVQNPTCIAYLACSYRKEYVTTLSGIESFDITVHTTVNGVPTLFNFVLTQRDHSVYNGEISAPYQKLYEIASYINNYHCMRMAIDNRVGIYDRCMRWDFSLSAHQPYSMSGQPAYPTNAQQPYSMGGQQAYPTNAQQPYSMGGQPAYPTNAQQPYSMGGQQAYPTNTQQPYSMGGQQPYSQLPNPIDVYQSNLKSDQKPSLHQPYATPNYSPSSYHQPSSDSIPIDYPPPPSSYMTPYLTPSKGNADAVAGTGVGVGAEMKGTTVCTLTQC